MTADIWADYVSALLRIETPGGVIWVRPAPVTRTDGEYPDPDGRTICVITAHNPGGRTVSDAMDASAQARLVAELERRGLTWWPTAGGDPSWAHVGTSAAVIGMNEADAIALGAEFGQDAVFVLTPADRRVIGCADRRVVATGWSIQSRAELAASASANTGLDTRPPARPGRVAACQTPDSPALALQPGERVGYVPGRGFR